MSLTFTDEELEQYFRLEMMVETALKHASNLRKQADEYLNTLIANKRVEQIEGDFE